ncbi:MAG: amidohydrolase [Rhizobiales bacterium]|nr:amidohydrolase [Hyphomicrobiales bacterium]
MNADLIIRNGHVLTMDEAQPVAEAIAIAGNTILAVGRDAEVRALIGSKTRDIDAAGGTVLPGFIESHMHLFTGAAELDHLNLEDVSGFPALRDAVAAHAAAHPGDGLMVAEQANYIILGERQPVTRQHLDRIVADRPFMMFAYDHHTAWANSLALEQAGILKGRELGPGSEIVMGSDGLATGELREFEAFGPVRGLSPYGSRARLGLMTGGEPEPPPTPTEFAHDLKVIGRGLAHCARHGITSIHNMDGNFYTLELLEELEHRGELTARARVPFHFVTTMGLPDLETASAMAARYRSEKLASGFVKLFVDGVVESSTAVLMEDYASRPGWRGEPLFTAERFAAIAIEADACGLQIAVHAIGDGAVRLVLDGYAAARAANGARDSRHRVEHVELIQPGDIPRFREMGVIASMQPPHAPGCQSFPLEPYLSMIGRERWPQAFAWNELRAAGTRLVFASDWPVSDINPMRSIKSAMTRKPWAPDLADQRQTLEQALAAYTRDAAFAEFMEHRKGQLRQGFLADLVVLSGDLAATPPEDFGSIRPSFTICDGRVVFEAS